MQLQEIFSAASFEITEFKKNHGDQYYGEFSVGAEKVRVFFDLYDGVWELEFSRNSKTEITGGKQAFKIFGTVVEILRRFLKEERPKYFSFNAHDAEGSRVKLYHKFAEKMPAFGYKQVTEITPDLKPYADSVDDGVVKFLFQRK